MGLRVLALCGMGQNALVFSRILAKLQATLPDVVFVFLEPPLILHTPDPTSMIKLWRPPTSCQNAISPKPNPRVWFEMAKDQKVYYKVEECISYMHQAIVDLGNFDGIIGFSQGGCAALILSALLANPKLNHPNFPYHPTFKPIRFLITAGAYLPQCITPSFASLFPLPQSLATLHIAGRKETVVVPVLSEELASNCENTRLEFHNGGHTFPTGASWRAFLRAYILSFNGAGTQGHHIPPPTWIDQPALHEREAPQTFLARL